MQHTRKNFLERLQSADESVKRRWMFASVVIVMILVTYVWLAYFNNLVAGWGNPAPVASAGGFGVMSSLKSGTAMLYGTFVEKIRALKGLLGAPREIVIQPGS